MAALFLGMLTGFVNLNSSEPQLTVLLLLAFGFFLGHVTHKAVWKYALILGIFVPLSEIVRTMAIEPNQSSLGGALSTAVAVLPALIGAYIGKFVGPVDHSKEVLKRGEGGNAA